MPKIFYIPNGPSWPSVFSHLFHFLDHNRQQLRHRHYMQNFKENWGRYQKKNAVRNAYFYLGLSSTCLLEGVIQYLKYIGGCPVLCNHCTEVGLVLRFSMWRVGFSFLRCGYCCFWLKLVFWHMVIVFFLNILFNRSCLRSNFGL